MAVFSTNQARQLYVAKELQEGHLTSDDNVGAIAVTSDTAKNHMYFEYMGADNLMRSDLIDVNNILWAKATSAADMAKELKAVIVTLDKDVNGGNPVVGQDYVLRINFKQFVGMSDADQYNKYGMVHVHAGINNASKLYANLAVSLAKNFSREFTKLVSIKLESGSDSKVYDEVTASTKLESLTKSYTGIAIEEVEQPWVLGTMSRVPMYFEVYPSTVLVEGDELTWGKVKDAGFANTLDNGKDIADLEYFCMGERGDIYRGAGYPNNIITKYLVDLSEATKYDVIDIHYAYVGSNEAVQKSEKTITIVVPAQSNHTLANNIITAINNASGLSIKAIS